MQETLMMIPDCHRRLLTAHSELSNLLETEAELNVDGEVEEFVAALAQIKEAEEQMKVEWYYIMLVVGVFSLIPCISLEPKWIPASLI